MASVTIQPSTIDTSIQQGNPTNNYGTFAYLTIFGQTNYIGRGFLKFDFSAVVPPGATITLATLSLYCSGLAAASRTITVYRLLRTDWVELEATWNIYKTGSNWGTAGALNTTTDITTTDAATAASVAVNNWLNETVTAQVQTALDSVGGVAHFLVADVGGGSVAKTNYYASRNYTANTSLRPKLYIEYTGGSWPLVLPKVNVGGVWKSPVSMAVNIGGTWKTVVSVKVNIGGTWKDLT